MRKVILRHKLHGAAQPHSKNLNENALRSQTHKRTDGRLVARALVC